MSELDPERVSLRYPYADPAFSHQDVEDRELSSDRQISPHQVPFIERTLGIDEQELQRREAAITEMGGSPREGLGVRNGRYLVFMENLYSGARDIIAREGEAAKEKIESEGREYSESVAMEIILASLLAKSILSARCVSCGYGISGCNNHPEVRFFPIEILEKEKMIEYTDEVRVFARGAKDSLFSIYDIDTLTWVTETARVLNDEGQEEEKRVYNADWFDVRVALDPDILRRAIEGCVSSYLEYRKVIQKKEDEAERIRMEALRYRTGDSV
ncbi:MAG: hypothetical protein LBF49_00925 [Puniceicoccales bacterium]|jgi:hypothetical protein|nr:hypothetical protein [Puniceicoccales bacterium]